MGSAGAPAAQTGGAGSSGSVNQTAHGGGPGMAGFPAETAGSSAGGVAGTPTTGGSPAGGAEFPSFGGGGASAMQACEFSPNDGAEKGVVPGSTPPASQDWTFTLGESNIVPNTAGVPIYPWFPDGHITVLPDGGGNFLMFWAEVESYRTVGPSVLPDTHTHREPEEQLFHGRIETSTYDNGGIWLHSVFRKSGQSLIGFFAAEDQYCCPRDPHQVAWRAMGVTYSSDNGATWSGTTPVLTANEERPTLEQEHIWGGNGDGSAIWDPRHCRWMIFYQHEYVTAAVSYDPEGKPGTWLKYFKAAPGDAGDFTEPGLRGRDSPLEGLEAVHGGNPSVHFNSYLGKWVMVYHGWDPQRSYIASSSDLVHWDTPRFLVDTAKPPGRGWYPTIIGETDLRAAESAELYYTDMDREGARYFMHRHITFTRHD